MVRPDMRIRLRKDEYEIIEQIGQGGYGVVSKARRLSDGLMAAVKTVQTCDPDNGMSYTSRHLKKVVEALENETAFLRKLSPKAANSGFILSLLDEGRHENRPVLALELCQGSLGQVYETRRDGDGFPFDGPTLLRWIAQTATALELIHGMHRNGAPLALRDLKPSNILIKDGDVRLSDFGTVKPLVREVTRSVGLTVQWAAPGTFLPRSKTGKSGGYRHSQANDLYALGLVIHALVTGKPTEAQRELNGLINASGEPFPGTEDRLATIGELTGDEAAVLAKDLRSLFAPKSATLLQGGIVVLPDVELAAERTVDLVRDLLSPRSAARPEAAAAKERVLRIGELLSPRLEALEADPIPLVAIGEGCAVRVAARGRGLPGHGKWLNVSLAGEPMTPSAIRRQGGQWMIDLPPFEVEGRHEARVAAYVDGKVHAVDAAVTVEARPEQLWARRRWAEALTADPDRTAWLNFLEKKARRSVAFRRKYIGILEAVLKRHPNHVDVNFRYWEARRRAERRKGRPMVAWALCAAVVVGVGIWRFWPGPVPADDPVEPPGVSEPENPPAGGDLATNLAADQEDASGEEPGLSEPDERPEPPAEVAGPEPVMAPEAPLTVESPVRPNDSAEEERLRQARLEAERAEELRRQREEEARLQAEKEKQQREAAIGVYQNAKALLADGKWERAQAVLKEDAELLNQYLDDVDKANLALLNQFCQHLEDGDAEKNKQPLNLENLEVAEQHYTQAKAKAIELPDDVKVWHIANDKLKETIQQQEAFSASEAFDKIMAFANAGDWKQTQKLLFEKIDLLKRRLPETDKATAVRMETYFRELENGGREQSQRPEQAAGYEAAIEHYKKAQAIEPDLPAGLAKLGLAKGRIEDAEQRLVELKKKEEEEQAATKRKYHLRRTPMESDSSGELGYRTHLENDFQGITEKAVTDRATGLMWQRHGSNRRLTYTDSKRYIRQLNSDRFAGYNSWRLPTVSELASLVENVKIHGLFIDQLFDRRQSWCWSSDTRKTGGAWDVSFSLGKLLWSSLEFKNYVRAVRPVQ